MVAERTWGGAEGDVGGRGRPRGAEGDVGCREEGNTQSMGVSGYQLPVTGRYLALNFSFSPSCGEAAVAAAALRIAQGGLAAGAAVGWGAAGGTDRMQMLAS